MHLLKKARKEMRTSPRRKILLSAVVTHKKRSAHEYPCVLKDLSETGCQLVGTLLSSVDDRFYLRTEAFPEPRLCAVAWRARHMIGAVFIAETVAQIPEALPSA